MAAPQVSGTPALVALHGLYERQRPARVDSGGRGPAACAEEELLFDARVITTGMRYVVKYDRASRSDPL